MDSYEEKLDSDKLSQSSTCNTTYAQVLSKGSDLKNSSNNNPIVSIGTINGNENIFVDIHEQDSAIIEASLKSVDLNLAELSQSDSFEDTDSQTIDSTSTVKSVDFTQNITEETSLITTNSDTRPNNETSNSHSSDCGEGCNGTDFEEEDISVDDIYSHPPNIKPKLRSNVNYDLPETVTMLETSSGSKVFIVGTAHFSKESQEDVAKTIKAVQPDVVMMELCKSRVNILSLDEETILEESRNMNFQKIKAAIEQNGFLQGALYLLLLNMSAHFTKQLGMAPGGEFRRAFLEAKQIPGCIIHLGDRPIHITLQRALATLSWFQKLHIAWKMLRAKEPISKEEVEKCKQKDLLEEMLAEMTGEFPELSHVFVKERDIYLTYSLQMAAATALLPQSKDTINPSYIVGVVGIGHVPGIVENWEKVTEKDIPPILCVPEPSMSSRIMRKSVRLSIIGLGIYGIYKIYPKSWIPSRLFSSLTLYFRL